MKPTGLRAFPLFALACLVAAGTALLPPTARAQDAPARAAQADVTPVMRTPSADMLATIRKRGKLRVGVITVDPMVMRRADGDYEGYSIDLVRRMASEMDVGLEIVQTSALFMLPELLDSRFDLIATGLWVTTERAMTINFTEPTASEGVYLIANKQKAGKKLQVADYNQAGVKIAVFSNTVQEKLAARMFPKAQVLRVDGNELKVVAQGDAHAALVPTLAPDAVVKQSAGKLFLVREQALSHTPAALGIRKGDPDFLNFLNTWLSLRRGEGWLDERARFWATKAASK